MLDSLRIDLKAIGACFAIASVILLAAACTSDPDPTATPRPAPTTVPAPEPTATPEPEPTATPEPEPTATPEPEPTALSQPEPTATTAPEPAPTAKPETDVSDLTDEEITRAYVEAAIQRYEDEGLDATVRYYSNPASIEGERTMMILREGDQVILATPRVQILIGTNTRSGPQTPLGRHLAGSTADGHWFETQTVDQQTGKQVPRANLAVLHDGLIFVSGHVALAENLAAFTQSYVQNAIDFYDQEGLDATIAFYDSAESVDGQFYLFLIDEDDIYLAHPIFPHLKGTDIKDVVGSNGYELGKEIAKATEDGHWVEYLWPNPVNLQEEQKTAWVKRHDGLIFASGHYTRDENVEEPEWKGADPEEYTIKFVEDAVARYESEGLDAMLNYYNSVASFQGQWYLFATDEDDIYIVHPLLPHLKGTDIKNVVGSDGYELGQEFAKVADEPTWIEYLWPHPVTLREAPKVAYAVRHDGIMFASGYYSVPDDPGAYTEAYVQEAIERYKRDGLEATVEYYNSEESIDGQWYLTVYDGNIVLTNPIFPQLVGRDITTVPSPTGSVFGDRASKATAEGLWIRFPWPNSQTSEDDQRNMWAVLYDGLIFTSGYFSAQ